MKQAASTSSRPLTASWSRIERLQSVDFSEVASLLVMNQLLVTDLSPEDMKNFWGAKLNGKIVAVGGIQIFGTDGLLRSIAILNQHQRNGYGKLIVEAVEDYAETIGLQNLHLLTETAEAFFHQLNYTTRPRLKAPCHINSSLQFTELCADDAVYMVKQLTPNQ